MKRKKAKTKAPAAGARARMRKGRKGTRYSDSLRMKAVRLHLEEGMARDLICGEFGINPFTFDGWVRKYRRTGESALDGRAGNCPAKSRVPPPVKAKIVEVKKANPPFGIQKISDMLRRFFSMKASPDRKSVV